MSCHHWPLSAGLMPHFPLSWGLCGCVFLYANPKAFFSLLFAAKKAHTASLVVLPGETAEFDVVFQAQHIGRMTGNIHLSVINNQYEDTIIHMVGEGYEDDITLDNVHGLVASTSGDAFDISEIIEDGPMVAGGRSNSEVLTTVGSWVILYESEIKKKNRSTSFLGI